MSKQVITIGYLKEFVSGILDVSIAYDNNAYCPTYKELTDGSICKYYVSDSNPTKTTNGIRIPTCTIDSNENDTYSSNQLVIRQDLELLYQQLQSVTVTPDKTSGVSCCGESVGLTTTAYFKLVTKKEGGTTTAETSTNATVTATYSEDKDYTSIASSKLKFEKNSIAYQRGVTESVAARSSKVTASYTYSGVTKTDDETVTQNGNSAKAWSHISDTTTKIKITPSGMTFGSCESSQTYSVTRYYDSYYERYDQCGALLDTRTDKNNGVVTPSKAEKTGSFTVTTSKVSVGTNTGAYRTGTLTVTYDSHTDSINLAQAASQAGRYYGAAYGQDFWFYVEPDTDDTVSCNGATVTFQSYYWSTYKKDYVDKDHCGNQTGSGTTEYPSTINVTSNTTWESNRGTMSSNVLTIGSTTSDVTTKVTATYNAQPVYTVYEIYQSGCKPAEKTEIVVTFTGRYETLATDKSDGDYGCSGKYIDNPGQIVMESDIDYAIECEDDNALSVLSISYEAQSYHLGKEHTGATSFTPTNWAGTLPRVTRGDLTNLVSDTICYQIEQGAVITSWTASVTDTTNYKVRIVDNVGKESGGSSGGGTTPEPKVTGISIFNNQPGDAKVIISYKNADDVYTLGKRKDQVFSQTFDDYGTVSIEYDANKWCNSSSCFVKVEFLGENLKPEAGYGNNVIVREDADGYTFQANSSGSCSGSIACKSGNYTVMVNIKYMGNPTSNF